MTPERAFVLLGGVVGALLVVLSPPLYWGDENTHFLHSYRLAQLRFDLTPRDDRMTIALPRGVGQLQLLYGLDRALRERGTRGLEWTSQVRNRLAVEDTDQVRVLEVANANYPLLGYAPQALGIALARLCTSSVLLQLYAARLANLVAWLALMWTALRTAPAFKVPLAVLALAPMSVFVATTCSADAATNGLAFLWSAWIVRTALAPSPPRRSVVVLIVLGVALALVKTLYGPLLLLLLAVPAARFGGARRRGVVLAAVAGTAASAVLLWALASRAELASGIAYRKDSAVAENLALLAHDPVRVVTMVARRLFLADADPWIDHVTASMWGVSEPDWLTWAWLAAVVAAALADPRSDVWPSVRERIVAGIAALASLSAIALVSFVLWTPAGAEAITGFQGRYGIAVLPSLLVALCPPRRLRVTDAARAGLAVTAFAVVALLLGWLVARGVALYAA